MNHYETVFILTPVLSDAQMKEAVDKVKDVITSANGTRDSVPPRRAHAPLAHIPPRQVRS